MLAVNKSITKQVWELKTSNIGCVKLDRQYNSFYNEPSNDYTPIMNLDNSRQRNGKTSKWFLLILNSDIILKFL